MTCRLDPKTTASPAQVRSAPGGCPGDGVCPGTRFFYRDVSGGFSAGRPCPVSVAPGERAEGVAPGLWVWHGVFSSCVPRPGCGRLALGCVGPSFFIPATSVAVEGVPVVFSGLSLMSAEAPSPLCLFPGPLGTLFGKASVGVSGRSLSVVCPRLVIGATLCSGYRSFVSSMDRTCFLPLCLFVPSGLDEQILLI